MRGCGAVVMLLCLRLAAGWRVGGAPPPPPRRRCAYSIENYDGVTRHNVDVNVSAYDLAATYMRPFEKAIVDE